MRTIKFRGKEIQNGIWVEGYYRHHKTSIGTFSHIVTEDGVDYIVDPETVGQFTGLTDKNGKEIYEGDILNSSFSYRDKTSELVGVVEADKCNPCFVIHYKWQGSGHDCYEYDFIQAGLRTNEIIGNIHDNPDLLK